MRESRKRLLKRLKQIQPGAVALVIRMIEQAGWRQDRKEKETPTHVG